MYEQLRRNGYKARLFLESTADHPLFRKWSENNIDEWLRLYLLNWQHFLAEDSDSSKVIVMESALFQVPILSLLSKDMNRSSIIAFVEEQVEILSQHETSLLYLYQEDSWAAIDNMIECRGGAEFILHKDEEYGSSKYYQNRAQHEGSLHVAFLRDYADISNQLIQQVKLPGFTIDNTNKNWHRYEQQMLERYNLVHYPDHECPEEEIQRYVGTYRNHEMGINVHINSRDGALFIFGDRKLKGRENHCFYVDDMSVEVVFVEHEGNVDQLIIGEKDIYANRHDQGTRFERIEE
ncbi:hypothetical protein [Paenibacillus marinisediminis]